MAKRYFNWKLAIVLLIALVVLGATAVGLRAWQRSRRAAYGLEAGIKAYDQQQWEQAAKDLGRYLAVERDDVPALLKYADAQLKIRPAKPGNVQQAIAAYRSVLRIDKNSSEAAMRLTEVYLGIGMPGEAELIARRQLEGDPSSQQEPEVGTQTKKDPELRRLFALALAQQRKFSEAAAELKAILHEHPDQVLAYETLGQLTEQRPRDFQDPPDQWYNQAVNNNPSSALAYVSRAGFYLRQKDIAKALADLEQAERLDLSDSDTRLRLAIGFINANALDKAEQHLAAMQESTPADQSLWQTWAQAALKSQSQEKMLKVAETGLKELSSQPWEFMPIATELFIRAGQLDRATDCISKLRQKDIFLEIVAFMEGLVADQKGQYFEAVKCWRRAIESGNESAQVRLALASTYSRLGDTQSALQQLRTLVSERPNFLDGRLALVRILARSANWSEVAEQARRTTQLSPENLEAALYYLRARIYLLAMQATEPTAKMWQDIESQLASLEKATDGAADVKLLQFQLAMQQDNLGRAGNVLTQLKEGRPPSASIALAEAQLLAAQEKTKEAISTLKEATVEFPDAIEPVTSLAILLHRQDNRKECEAILKEALARIEQPGARRELGLLLAQIYAQWGEQDKEYQLLKTLTEKLPNDIPLKRRLLVCEQVIKDHIKAQQVVSDIKALEGEHGWQWRYEQARLWFAGQDFKQRYPQITALLQENLLASPDDQASRALLAATYDRGGELLLAISTYREALRRSPDDLRIIIPAVTALYKAKEYDQAEQILSRASQERLYHPELQRLQLQSHLQRGELTSASNILEDLLRNDPNNRSACWSLALLKMQQNKFAESEQLLNSLKIHEPNSLAVTSVQVKLNILQDKSQQALRLCDEMVSNLNNASAYILRARAYAELRQADKALQDLEHATSIEPNSTDVWTAKSDFHSSMGQPDESMRCLQQALSLEPNNIQIQKRAIALLLAAANADSVHQGRAMLDQALASNPEDTDLHLFKARSLLAEGTAPAIENAEQILQKITEDQPENDQAWLLLGEILLRQAQPGRAIDVALRGLVHNPNNKTLLLLKANAEAARSPVFAISTLNVLREMDPNDVDVALRLADTYITMGESDKAVNLLKTQLAHCSSIPERRLIDIALAVALNKNGNKAEAQEKLDILLKSEPNDPGPFLVHVRLLRDEQLWSQLSRKVTEWSQSHPKDTDTLVAIATDLAATEDSQAKEIAEDSLRRILDRDANNLSAMNTLAILLQTVGRNAESATLYHQILNLTPDNVVAINNLAWIMCEEQGNFQQALELARKGLQLAPQYIDLIDTRGMVHYRLGELDKAIQDFTECIRLYPSGVPAAVASRFHLARALAKLGQTDKAIEQLNQALDSHSQIGGLSTTDLAEARSLLEQLQRGS